MKKIIPFIIIGLVAILFIAGAFMGSIVKKGIESVAPDIAGVAITIDDVEVSAFGGVASISGLIVKNPDGFKSDHAFRLGSINIDLKMSSLFSDTIVINKIMINAPSISYELGLSGTNINTIANNIAKNTASDTPATADAKTPKTKGAGKKVIINHVYIYGAKVKAGIGNAQAEITLPNIHLTDIGKENKDQKGTSFAAATKLVMAAITKELATADLSGLADLGGAKDAIIDKAKDKLKDATKGLTKGLKGLF